MGVELLTNFACTDKPETLKPLTCENSWHFCGATTGFPANAEIRYLWCVTTQICVVLLICWIKVLMQHDQSEALPRSSDVLSVWNSCALFSGVILREMSAVFLGYRTTDQVGNVGCYEKKKHPWKLVCRNQSDPSEIECWNQNSKGDVCRRVERQALAYSPTTNKLHFCIMARTP